MLSFTWRAEHGDVWAGNDGPVPFAAQTHTDTWNCSAYVGGQVKLQIIPENRGRNSLTVIITVHKFSQFYPFNHRIRISVMNVCTSTHEKATNPRGCVLKILTDELAGSLFRTTKHRSQ